MKLKFISGIIFDKICVYKENSSMEFIDLYSGNSEDIPYEILEMEVKSIASKRKGIIDIRVE